MIGTWTGSDRTCVAALVLAYVPPSQLVGADGTGTQVSPIVPVTAFMVGAGINLNAPVTLTASSPANYVRALNADGLHLAFAPVTVAAGQSVTIPAGVLIS